MLLLLAGRATAFEFSEVSSASPEVLQCMEEKLESETMDYVRNGSRPKKKSVRKEIKTAYESCLTDTDKPADVVAYDGPLFDAMSQIDETVNMNEAMDQVRAAGVSKLALFARSRKKLHQNERSVLTLARKNPDLIVLGAPKYFQLSGDVTDDYISATVSGIKKHGYKFIGELLYTHGDKQTGKQYSAGERYVDPSQPGTTKLLKAVAPLNIPFMAHWEPYTPERDFPKFHALYSAWPDQIFLLPHMGFASVDQLDEFMSRHPNLYLLTSKKERYMGDFADPEKQKAIGSSMLDGEKLRPEWKELLIKYQDRILFASDPHMRKLWAKYRKVVNSQRLILGQLPRKAAERIAYRNAERMYGVKIDQKRIKH
ncbi:amidohydrolase family protein [Pseudodesulfovibrio sp. zrk46]|uniref:amidohydrolase family protein n=1 Tax=Pseudodesulfovibrio sp. zrk46 TaxID=2725288 RepID=UPI001448AE73|nr:amidohydrolase family protein [Pseudodesulfovibrio sp. zrk46]QJB55260.1 amidohydrolase family protein [Pseudodesulfovibrio sp. zrk46]